MSRRNAAEKRPILPDPQFNSRLATMMVVRLMQHGKKSTAQRILSDAFGPERVGQDPLRCGLLAVLHQAHHHHRGEAAVELRIGKNRALFSGVAAGH